MSLKVTKVFCMPHKAGYAEHGNNQFKRENKTC